MKNKKIAKLISLICIVSLNTSCKILTTGVIDGLGNNSSTTTAQNINSVKSSDRNISLVNTFIKESDGNGDNKPNKGESVYLQPTFSNTSFLPTKSITVKLSSTSDLVEVVSNYSMSLSDIEAGSTSPRVESNYNSLLLKISKDAAPGTSIPITYTLKEASGNEWKINDNIVVEPIANKISLAKTNIKESDGNGDNKPNKGESLYLQPTFTNSGSSSTNPLTVKLSSTSDLVEVVSNYSMSLSDIEAGSTSPRVESNYNSLLLKISKSAKEGSSIPITYTLIDSFGNQWKINDTLVILSIANKISLAKTNIKESDGNGDNKPNKGESLYLQPTFTNSGSSSTNPLTVKLSSTSDLVEVVSNYSMSLSDIEAGSTSPRVESNYNSLLLKISKSAKEGSSIPITYTLSDSFNNTWSISDNILVDPIANNITLSKTNIKESDGNGDNVPNRGESLYLQPTFTNSGLSSTNPLTVKLSSTSDLVEVVSNYSMSLSDIESGSTSPRVESNYNSLLLKISKDAAPGTSIPITYTLSDSFNNTWSILSSLTIM